MSKKKNQAFSIFLAVIMMVCILPMSVSAKSYSGTCGDDLKWSLDTEKGVLKITGSGNMSDYEYYHELVSDTYYATSPWYKQRKYIKTVNLSNDITSIGKYAFFGCTNLTKVIFPEKLNSISNYSFSYCRNLKNIVLPASVKSVDKDAFFSSTINQIAVLNKSLDLSFLEVYGYWDYGQSYLAWTVNMSVDTVYAYNKGSNKSIIENNGWKFVNLNKFDCSNNNHCYDFYAMKYITKPTCSEKGKGTQTCVICGKTSTTSIKTTPHKTKNVIATQATPTKDGKIETTCTVCNKVTKTTVIPNASNITLSTKSYIYDNKEKKPGVTVKDSKGKTLKKGTDFTVAYKNNKAIGKATITVTFKGNYSGTKSLSFKIIPAKVTGLKATQTTSSVSLTWNKTSGATSYNVYKVSKNKYTKVATVKTNKATISKLKTGVPYSFAVEAVANSQVGAKSAILNTTTKPAVPTLKATAGSKKAVLSWNKVTGATGYEIYMATGNGKYTKIATVKNNVAQYTKSGLKTGTTYKFQIRAYKTIDKTTTYSDYSAAKSIKSK